MNEELSRLIDDLVAKGASDEEIDVIVQDYLSKQEKPKPQPQAEGPKSFGFLDSIKGAFNQMIGAAKTPAPAGQESQAPQKALGDAWNRGTNLAKQADIFNPFEEPEGERLEELASIRRESQKLPVSDAYRKFSEAKTTGEAFKALSEDFAGIVTELTVESLSSQAQYGASRIATGAGAGAVMGSVIPGVGTAAGAGGGFAVGMADTSLGLEWSSKAMEMLEELGVDTTDPVALEKAFNDQETMDTVKAKAYQKSVPIALFDLIGGGLAGKIVGKPAKSLIGKVGKGAADMALQAGFDGLGELTGEVVAGEEISPSAIIGEMVGGVGTSPVEIAVGAHTYNKQRVQENAAQKLVEDAADTGDPTLNTLLDQPTRITPEEQALIEEQKAQQLAEELEQDVKAVYAMAPEKMQQEIEVLSRLENPSPRDKNKLSLLQKEIKRRPVPVEESTDTKKTTTSNTVDKTEDTVKSIEQEQVEEPSTPGTNLQMSVFEVLDQKLEVEDQNGNRGRLKLDEGGKLTLENGKKVVELGNLETEIDPSTPFESVGLKLAIPRPRPAEKSVRLTPWEAIKATTQSYFKGMEKGVRKGQTDVNELTKKIQEAIKEFPLTKNQVSTILTKARKVNLFVPGSVSKFNDFVRKVSQDAEYADKLATVRDLNRKLRKLSKGTKNSPRQLRNVASLAKLYASIDPEDTFINQHLKYGNQLVNAMSAPVKVRSVDGQKVAERTNYAAVNEEELQSYLEDLKAKIDEGALDEAPRDVEGEVQMDPNVKLEALQERAAESLNDLKNKDLNDLETEEKETVKNLLKLQPSRLNESQLVEAIRVIDNIVVNDNFVNSAKTESLARAMDILDRLKAIVGDSKRFKLGRYGKLTNNLSRLIEAVWLDRKIAVKFRDLTGVQELFAAGSRVEKMVVDRSEQIAKMIKEAKTKNKLNALDVSNRIKMAGYALLMKHPVKSDPSVHVEQIKNNIRQTIKVLAEAGEVESSQIWGEFLASVENVKDANEAMEQFKKDDPALFKIWKFISDTFKNDTNDRLRETTENVYNKSYIEEENYTTTSIRQAIARESERKSFTAQAKDVATTLFANSTPSTLGAKQSSTSLKSSRKLNEGQVYSDDFIADQLRAYRMSLYDAETAKTKLTLAAVMYSKEFEELVGGMDNAKFIQRQVVLSDYVQQGLGGVPSNDALQAINLVSNYARMAGSARALGSTFGQVVKQFFPVIGRAFETHMISGTVKLWARSMGVKITPNIDKLFNNSQIGTVGLRLGGIERGNTISFNLSAGAKKKLARVLENAASFVDSNTRRSLAALTGADAQAKKRIWLSYYLKSLKDQGIEKVDLEKEHTLQNDPARKEAVAYAEHLISITQTPSNPAELSNFSKNTGNTAWNIIKNVIAPFSQYSLEAKARLVQHWRKAVHNPSVENWNDVVADLGEIATFSAIQYFVMNAYKDMAKGVIESWFDVEPEEGDEEDEEKRESRRRNSVIAQALNTVNPLTIGTAGEEAGSRFMNRLAYRLYWLKNNEAASYDMWKRATGGFAYESNSFLDYGLLALGLEPLIEAGSNTYQLFDMLDGEIYLSDDRDTPKILEPSDELKSILAIKSGMEWLSAIGLNEADWFNQLRKVYKEQLRMELKEAEIEENPFE